MKYVKIFLFIIAILLVVFIVLAMIGPNDYSVSRTVNINAPESMVYAQVSSLEKMNSWAPWGEEDSEMTSEIHGQDGTVGAYSRWEGPEAGVGEQKLVKLEENSRVETQLRFIEPWEDEASAYFDVKGNEDGTTSLTWGMTGGQNMMLRAMSMIPGMDMDSQIGPMFEKGLGTLKTMTEAEAERVKFEREGKYSIAIIERPSMNYLANMDEVPMEGISEFCGVNFPAIATAIGVSGNEITGYASAIYYKWDEVNGVTKMAVGFPVKEELKIQGYQNLGLREGRYLKAVYNGSYDNSTETYEAMDKYVAENRLIQDGPVLEEYVIGPSEDADPSKWVTHIYFSIK